jgi:putative protease
VYSRGLGPYFLTGTHHQQVVHGRAPRHRGVQVGTVVRVFSDGVHVKCLHTIKRGDGLVFDAATWRSPEEPEEGSSVYEVQGVSRDVVPLQFGRNAVDFARIRAGDLVWRSFDPALPRRLKRLTEATTPVSTRPVSFAVTARSGAPLQLVAQTANGHSPRVTGIVPLALAQHRALDEVFLREHLGKLGGTPFHLEAVTLDSAEPLFVPVSEVNALRRQVVEQLMALQTSYETPPTYRVVADTLAQLQPSVTLPTPAQVHVLVRTPEQLEAALAVRPAPRR